MRAEQVTAQVHAMFLSLLEELGETFSHQQFLAEVAYWRVKPLKIREVDFPPGITGGCLALKDIDLIAVRAGLEPLRLLFSELHECAHLLFGHVPACSITYQEFLRNPDLQAAVYRELSTAYDTPGEAAVELLATLLVERILRHDEEKRDQSTPPHMIDLFG